MGLLFGLVFWGAALSLFSVFSGFLLAGLVRRFLPAKTVEAKSVIRLAALLPAICASVATVLFLAYATANVSLWHRDAGIGDSWYAPTPNHYMLLMVDTTDMAFICYEGVEDCGSSPATLEAGVREMQVSGAYLLGSTDSRFLEDRGERRSRVDQWFLLDSNDKHVDEYASVEDLRSAAAHRGIPLKLESVESAYNRYRFGFFDYAFAIALVLIPLAGLYILFRGVARLRSGVQTI